MTGKTENANESKSETASNNSPFGFLIELTKTPVLFFFVTGFVCLAAGISRNIPGIGKVPNWGIPILIFVGILLMLITIKDYRRTITIQQQRDTYKDRHDKLSRQLETEQAERSELDEAINKALEILEGKDERDDIDSEVLQILRERTARLLKDLQVSPNQKIVSDWFNRQDRQDRLVSSLKNLEYGFLSNSSAREKFFSDIRDHLRLLGKNLQNGGYRSPQVDGLKKSISDSSAYVRAFKDLKIQILSEAEDDQDILNSSGIGYLRRHIDSFIQIIND